MGLMKERLQAGLLATLLLSPASGSALASTAWDASRSAQFARHEVIHLAEPAGGGLLRHRAVALFDYPPEVVFRVATSYDRYVEYMPRITSCHVLSQSPEQALVAFEADLPWPLANIWVQARYQHDLFSSEDGDRTGYRVRFTMLRGNLLRYEGSLLIEPYGEGRTTVTYELLAEPESKLPRGMVQRLLGRGVSNFVHYLRARVNNSQRRLQ